MDAGEHAPTPADAPGNRGSRWAPCLMWLVAGTTLVLLLAIGGVHAPARIKLLGLFAVAYGLLCGALLGTLAQALALPRDRGLALASGLLVAVGLVVMALESHRLHVERVAGEAGPDPSALFAEQMQLDSERPTDPVEAEHYDNLVRFIREGQEKRARELAARQSFEAYLAERTSAVGGWPSPWPAVLWGTELVLGGLAAAWLAARPRA